jgi:hypothetical protein
MFINTAKNFNKILDRSESSEPENAKTIFYMHQDSARFYLDNRKSFPTPENYQDAAKSILEITEIDLTIEQIEAILSLFPFARIKLSHDGGNDTEVREDVYNAICKFFAGCEAPTYGDKLNINRFIQHLQSQAKSMGYQVG